MSDRGSSYSPAVLRQTCPDCRAGYGEKCLDLRALRRGRLVVIKVAHYSRRVKAGVWR